MIKTVNTTWMCIAVTSLELPQKYQLIVGSNFFLNLIKPVSNLHLNKHEGFPMILPWLNGCAPGRSLPPSRASAEWPPWRPWPPSRRWSRQHRRPRQNRRHRPRNIHGNGCLGWENPWGLRSAKKSDLVKVQLIISKEFLLTSLK